MYNDNNNTNNTDNNNITFSDAPSGGKIDPLQEEYTLRCRDCGYVYKDLEQIDKCLKCNSKNLSNGNKIDFLDTSRGDKIDFFQKEYRFKCIDCGYVYEGLHEIDKCPRCSSKNLDDTDDPYFV